MNPLPHFLSLFKHNIQLFIAIAFFPFFFVSCSENGNSATKETPKTELEVSTNFTNIYKSAVYIGDPFSTANPSSSEIAQIISTANTIAASDFNAIYLSFLHLDTLDNLTYNYNSWFDGPRDTLAVYNQLDKVFANMKNATESVLQGGNIVAGNIYPNAPKKVILFSLGGYDNSQDILRAYAPNNGNTNARIKRVLTKYGIDGIDLDYEPFIYNGSCAQVWNTLPNASQPPNYNNQKGIDTTGFAQLPSHQMLASLTQTLRTQAGATYITAAPYESQSWWGQVGANNFDWWNVQFYEGTNDVSPNMWVSTFNSWMSVASGKPNSFLVPGTNAKTFSQQQLTDALTNLQNANIQSGGAFIWNYSHISNDNPGSWGTLIANFGSNNN